MGEKPRAIVETEVTGRYATRTKGVSIGAYQALRVFLPLIFISTFLDCIYQIHFLPSLGLQPKSRETLPVWLGNHFQGALKGSALMDVFTEQLKELETHKQISPHRQHGEIAGVSVSEVADLLGIEFRDLLNAMDKRIPVFNGKGYDLSPQIRNELKPNMSEVWLYIGWWSRVEAELKRKATSPIILKAAYDVHLNNEYARAYYRAEDKIIAALDAAERGDIAACEKYCGESQVEILLTIKRRNIGQRKFRQAMENLYTKPSLNGCPREKPPKSDDDAVQRSFRNFQSKISMALQAAELQRADICEKYCREALKSVSVPLLRKLEEGTAHD